MNRKTLINLLILFVFWKFITTVFLLVAGKFLPLQRNFLGGGEALYNSNPLLWAWVNFDGEHYLSLVRDGYAPLTYFFFPGYPFVVKLFSNLFGNLQFNSTALLGLIISNVFFFFSLVVFWELLDLDFDKKVLKTSLIFLILFPTSFFFGAFYTESMFLFLSIWSFYLARKNKWILAGLLGAFASATRVVGVALIPALLLEIYIQKKEKKEINMPIALLGTSLVGMGIFLYMFFLLKKTGDPLAFFHGLALYGGQRTSGFILLPQVFYRYFFKILPFLNYNYFPVVFTTFLELFTGIIFTIISIASFFKIRLSYALYLFLGFLIPTFSGSFSSLPRYVLVLFPAFILVSIYINSLPKPIKLITFLVSFLCLGIATCLFVRGYWVS